MSETKPSAATSAVKPAAEIKEVIRKQFASPVSVSGSIADEVEFVNEEFNRELQKERLKRLRDDNEARKNFADRIFRVTVIWMFCILVVVILGGMGKLIYSDAVLIALITTTTANVFGFFYVVVNYLFNKEKST
ncbi:hypothetical protein ACFSKU_05305 [Pontibacter silvestris]|uniref:Uncharacterized protein n=1 Tax=Pontibacter silvestris TaxID=2305183 RepID=A0ABW4WUI1_9BACT|nr:hypothetical protein [Pontibacter silvestris]MCC9136955.1 hypothetical protein [Pontibacter silvestris]